MADGRSPDRKEWTDASPRGAALVDLRDRATAAADLDRALLDLLRLAAFAEAAGVSGAPALLHTLRNLDGAALLALPTDMALRAVRDLGEIAGALVELMADTTLVGCREQGPASGSAQP